MIIIRNEKKIIIMIKDSKVTSYMTLIYNISPSHPYISPPPPPPQKKRNNKKIKRKMSSSHTQYKLYNMIG